MRSAVAVLAAAVVVAAGAGCSDDPTDAAGTTGTTATETTSTTGTTPTETETKPEETQPVTTSGERPEPPPDQSRYAAQVDDACRPYQEQIDDLPVPTDLITLERYFDAALPLARKQIVAVKAVKAPTNAEELRRSKLFVASLTELERALTRYLAAVRADNAEKVQATLTAANAAGAATRGYAASLDITACGGYSQ